MHIWADIPILVIYQPKIDGFCFNLAHFKGQKTFIWNHGPDHGQDFGTSYNLGTVWPVRTVTAANPEKLDCLFALFHDTASHSIPSRVADVTRWHKCDQVTILWPGVPSDEPDCALPDQVLDGRVLQDVLTARLHLDLFVTVLGCGYVVSFVNPMNPKKFSNGRGKGVSILCGWKMDGDGNEIKFNEIQLQIQ